MSVRAARIVSPSGFTTFDLAERIVELIEDAEPCFHRLAIEKGVGGKSCKPSSCFVRNEAAHRTLDGNTTFRVAANVEFSHLCISLAFLFKANRGDLLENSYRGFYRLFAYRFVKGGLIVD